MTQRDIDINGYITVEKNPISRCGVFPYLGRSISSDLEPDKIYYVLRPPEELSDPEAMASFRMAPLIDDHEMLGEGFTPVEEKEAHGTLGENISFENGILYATLRIWSKKVKELLASGKKALSLGYRVGEWEKKAGVFNGQAYEFIQRKIRGNHIALVDEARMGKDIAVLDGFAFDSFEVEIGDNMAEDAGLASKYEAKKRMEESKGAWERSKGSRQEDNYKKQYEHDLKEYQRHAGDSTAASEKQAAPTGNSKDGAAEKPKGANDMADKKKDGETEICDAEEMKKKKEAEDKAAKDAEEKEGEQKEKSAKDAEEKEKEEKEAKDAEEKEEKEKKGAMDAAIKPLVDRIASLEKTTVKTLMAEINTRNKVAAEVQSVVGTFDAAEKTTTEVLAHGLDKVGIKVAAGHEQAAWAGYMAGRKASGSDIGFSVDAAPILKSDSVAAKSFADSK